MSFQLKTVLISFAAALLLALLWTTADRSMRAGDFMMAFGLVGFFGGIMEVVAGLFLLIAQDKRYAQGFLISGGLLMVTGFGACTAGLGNMSFH
jgi:hypothetical protein